MKNGVVYIVFGDKYLKRFNFSVKTLKKIHPNVHVTLFTDKQIEHEYIDDIRIIDVSGTRIKQNYLYDSPYENTLYIDATGGIVGPITEVFGLMKRFDFACVQDLIRKHKKKSNVYPDYADIPDGFPEYSGGLLLFRKCTAVENFFDAWCKNYDVWCKITGEHKDQPSLRVSLWQSKDLRIHSLPTEFSIRTKEYHNIVPRIYFYHNMNKENLEKRLKTWR